MASAEDFARLVSRANPAARGQYLAPGSPSTPSGAAQYDLDPFFEDGDDDGPSPSYSASVRTGNTAGLMGSAPNLPLTSNAAPPGHAAASASSLPQGWDFQDDAVAAVPPPIISSVPPGSLPRRWRRWRWLWTKEVQLEGEREIWLNDSSRNHIFPTNSISTSKYNIITFLPKFLAGAHVSLMDCKSLCLH
jgi:phospholipid-transporting ATPase